MPLHIPSIFRPAVDEKPFGTLLLDNIRWFHADEYQKLLARQFEEAKASLADKDKNITDSINKFKRQCSEIITKFKNYSKEGSDGIKKLSNQYLIQLEQLARARIIEESYYKKIENLEEFNLLERGTKLFIVNHLIDDDGGQYRFFKEAVVGKRNEENSIEYKGGSINKQTLIENGDVFVKTQPAAQPGANGGKRRCRTRKGKQSIRRIRRAKKTRSVGIRSAGLGAR